MVERQVEIVNRLGLHARAAAKLVHLSNRFQSRITIQKDGQEVDGKSILGLLLLAAAHGSQLVIRCDGEDESEAIDALAELVALRFEEKT
jgi:phosphocarrier protein